jgi:hypothetical protein
MSSEQLFDVWILEESRVLRRPPYVSQYKAIKLTEKSVIVRHLGRRKVIRLDYRCSAFSDKEKLRVALHQAIQRELDKAKAEIQELEDALKDGVRLSIEPAEMVQTATFVGQCTNCNAKVSVSEDNANRESTGVIWSNCKCGNMVILHKRKIKL